jgi:hypothetical protein
MFFPKNDAIIHIGKDDTVFSEKDTFINLALNEVSNYQTFMMFFEPVIASLLEAIETFVDCCQ